MNLQDNIAKNMHIYIYTYICIYTYTHTHLSECVEVVYELLLLPNNDNNNNNGNNNNNSFTQLWICAKYLLEIYQWGVGLVVTGRIDDIQRVSSISPSHFHIFFLITFLEKVFIRFIL